MKKGQRKLLRLKAKTETKASPVDPVPTDEWKSTSKPGEPGSAASDWDKEHEPSKVPQGGSEKAFK